jgi:methionine biosynthesis protein MetW
MYPEVLLSEMKRISKYQIVSFPNFAHYKNRLDLLIKGRMPKPMMFGYKWYNTGHIHQLSIKDFRELVQDVGGLRVLHINEFLPSNRIKRIIIKKYPTLFQILQVFLLEKNL